MILINTENDNLRHIVINGACTVSVPLKSSLDDPSLLSPAQAAHSGLGGNHQCHSGIFTHGCDDGSFRMSRGASLAAASPLVSFDGEGSLTRAFSQSRLGKVDMLR